MKPAEFTDVARAVNNWGRWGDDDERGTLNLITDASVRAGVAAVRDGKRFSLAIPMSEDGPQLGFVKGRTNPIRTTIAKLDLLGDDEAGVRFNDDAVTLGVQSATHIDALAHVSYDGRMYNGFPTSIIDDTGATRLGAEKLGPIVSRGVLLDLAAAAGVDRLDGGHALTADDLDRAEDFGKVTVGAGDIVLLRTGQMQHFHGGDKMAYSISTAGPSLKSARWFHDRDVAVVATDNLSFEVFPGEIDGLWLPVHMIHIVEMGLVQGQNFDLEALAADCADDARYEFLINATPEPIVHAAGAPTTPVVMK
jgi:kynurenine formamidase